MIRRKLWKRKGQKVSNKVTIQPVDCPLGSDRELIGL